MQPTNPESKVEAAFRDGRVIDHALRQAFRETVIRHKKLGQPMVFGRDGKVVIVPAEDLVIPPDDDQKPIDPV